MFSPARDEDDAEVNYEGDYSTRMEELFGDEAEGEGNSADDDDDDEFVYDGVDAEQVSGANYQQQLRDVLGSDDASDNLDEEVEVETSLLRDDPKDSVDLVCPSFTPCPVAKMTTTARCPRGGQLSAIFSVVTCTDGDGSFDRSKPIVNCPPSANRQCPSTIRPPYRVATPFVPFAKSCAPSKFYPSA